MPVYNPTGLEDLLTGPGDWIDIPLLNGWANLGGVNPPFGYYVDRGRCYLRGVIIRATAGMVIAASLPVAPQFTATILAATQNWGASWNCYIDPSGNLYASGGNGWIALDGISFRVA